MRFEEAYYGWTEKRLTQGEAEKLGQETTRDKANYLKYFGYQLFCHIAILVNRNVSLGF
jgi:hypothetical protein